VTVKDKGLQYYLPNQMEHRSERRAAGYSAVWIGRQKSWPDEAKRSWNHSSHGPGFLGEIMASQLGGQRSSGRRMGMTSRLPSAS